MTICEESAAKRGCEGIGVLNGERGPYGRQHAGGQWPTEKDPNASGQSRSWAWAFAAAHRTNDAEASAASKLVVRRTVIVCLQEVELHPPAGTTALAVATAPQERGLLPDQRLMSRTPPG